MADALTSPFSSFLARSLELLASEAPRHFAAVRASMRGLSVSITVGAASAVRVQLDVRPWVGPVAHAEITAEIGQRDLVALLEGSLTIEQALEDERLVLKGALDPLLSFLEALASWIHGAVRCRSFPVLYAQYLAAVRDAGRADRTETTVPLISW